MDLLILCLPWLAVGVYLVLAVRIPPVLPDPPCSTAEGWRPGVSIIIPARNEETNLRSLLPTLARCEYPDFEILVVDDGSEDGTPAVVREEGPGNAGSLRLVRGRALPEGWFGKPWACWQGAEEARGELLLFTDADTMHGPDLLTRAVAAVEAEEADVLTLIGRQVMGSFWERLLQPQFFLLLAARFPRAGAPRGRGSWRNAIANGQYLLFRREVYDALGGHRAVKGEVVEDMRFAQLLAQGGWRLVVREGRGLRTRMYRSLREVVAGWSKNITTGALQATGGWLTHVILPLSLLVGTVLWLLPPSVLAWCLLTGTGGAPLAFGAATTGFGVLLWALVTGMMGGNPFYGFLFPLGSVIAAYIFLLSWARGGRIRWKGREYSMSPGERRGWKGTEP